MLVLAGAIACLGLWIDGSQGCPIKIIARDQNLCRPAEAGCLGMTSRHASRFHRLIPNVCKK